MRSSAPVKRSTQAKASRDRRCRSFGSSISRFTGAGERGAVLHPHDRLGGGKGGVDVAEIAHMRPVQHRHVQLRRLDRVLPPVRHHRPAQKGNVGKPVPQSHLADRIGKVDLAYPRRSASPCERRPERRPAAAISAARPRRARDGAARGSVRSRIACRASSACARDRPSPPRRDACSPRRSTGRPPISRAPAPARPGPPAAAARRISGCRRR